MATSITTMTAKRCFFSSLLNNIALENKAKDFHLHHDTIWNNRFSQSSQSYPSNTTHTVISDSVSHAVKLKQKDYTYNPFSVIRFIQKQVQRLQHIHLIQSFQVIGKNHRIIMLNELEIFIAPRTHISDRNGSKLLRKIIQNTKNHFINQEEIPMQKFFYS